MNRNSPKQLAHPSVRKTAILLLLDILIIAFLIIVGLHTTWYHGRRRVQNGETLYWNLGLIWVSGSVNCSVTNLPGFYEVCMTIFTNLVTGTLERIQHFVCHMSHYDLKIEPHYLEDAYIYGQSCQELWTIYYYSSLTFAFLVVAALVTAISFTFLLRFAYARFSEPKQQYFWIALLTQILSPVLIASALIAYGLWVGATANQALVYVNTADAAQSTIVSARQDVYGIGWYYTVVLLTLAMLLALLTWAWVPIFPVADGINRAQRTGAKKKKPSQNMSPTPQAKPEEPSSERFWAYMPDVFNPHTYVAEFGDAERVALIDTNAYH